MAFTNLTEIRVGLMVVLSITLLVALSIAVGQLDDLLTDTISIKIEIPDVAGLEEYAPVKYSGVPIGRVMRIEYNETIDKAVIYANIRRNSPVSLDSICELAASSMLSPLYVEISGGSREQKLKYLLQDNKIKEVDIVLEAQPYLSISDLYALAGDVKNTLLKAQTTLDNLNEPLMVAGDLINNISRESLSLLNHLDAFVTNGYVLVEETFGNTNRFIVSASGEVMPMLKRFRKSSEKLDPLLSGINDKLTLLLDDADRLIQDINPEMKSIAQEIKSTIQILQVRIKNIDNSLVTLLADADHLIQHNRPDFDAMIKNLNRTSQNLDLLLEQLAQHPWRAVWKTDARRQPVKVSPDWNPDLSKP